MITTCNALRTLSRAIALAALSSLAQWVVAIVGINKGKSIEFVAASIHLQDGVVNRGQADRPTCEHLVKVLSLPRIRLNQRGNIATLDFSKNFSRSIY